MKELTKMSNYHNDLLEWLDHEEQTARLGKQGLEK